MMKRLVFLWSLFACAMMAFAQEEDGVQDSLQTQARLLMSQARYGEAMTLLLRCDSLLKDGGKAPKKVQREVDGMRATCAHQMALAENGLGHYHEALRLMTQAVDIRRRLYGTGDTLFVQSLNRQAKFFSYVGRLKDALRVGAEDVSCRRKIYGENSLEYAQALSDMAGYHSRSGNYPDAMSVGTAALEIRQRLAGEHSLEYASSLNNLARYNSYIGNSEESIRLGEQAIAIRLELLGKYHPDYAQSLSNQAGYWSRKGNYPKAIEIATEALEIRDSVLGRDHPDYAQSLNNLAKYNSWLGDQEEAIRLGTMAIDIRLRTLGRHSPDYAQSLANLAGYYSRSNNFTEAIRIGTEALLLRDTILGHDHPDYCQSLNNLSKYNYFLKNYPEAIRLCTEALHIRERILGKSHYDYAQSVNNLADYNYQSGNYAEAIRLGKEAIDIRRRAQGADHPDFAQSLANQAMYYFRNHQADSTEIFATNATGRYAQIVFRTFTSLTAEERNKFWKSQREWFFRWLPHFAYTFRTGTLIANAYNGALLSKGLLLNSEIEMGNLLLESGDMEVVQLYHDLQTNRMVLNKQYELLVNERVLSTDSLRRVIDQQERRLVMLSKTYGDYTRNLRISWTDVRNKLGDHDMAVEFLSFPVDGDSVVYVAFVLKKDYQSPKLIPLATKQQLASVPEKDYYVSTGLTDLVWRPLYHEMEGIENVYFSPAGEFYHIAIESLPYDTLGHYVSDQWELHRMSSTRELAVTLERPSIQHAVLYGGLTYNSGMDVLMADSRRYGGSMRDLTDEMFVVDGSDSRGNAEYLPATLTEVKEAAHILDSIGVSVNLFTDSLGTESSLKALSGKHVELLHLATHGFYWTEKQAALKNAKIRFLSAYRNQRPDDRVMVRSGLLFTGANTALNGKEVPPDVDDGILTAREITNLDLRGLSLLVLSACQTGLGDVQGDGVFGLQRGFKKAGAQSILMSLWSVDDEATHLLMNRFYNNLAAHMEKYDALRDAQHFVRAYVTPDGRSFAAPYYWAAFILLDAMD